MHGHAPRVSPCPRLGPKMFDRPSIFIPCLGYMDTTPITMFSLFSFCGHVSVALLAGIESSRCTIPLSPPASPLATKRDSGADGRQAGRLEDRLKMDRLSNRGIRHFRDMLQVCCLFFRKRNLPWLVRVGWLRPADAPKGRAGCGCGSSVAHCSARLGRCPAWTGCPCTCMHTSTQQQLFPSLKTAKRKKRKKKKASRKRCRKSLFHK